MNNENKNIKNISIALAGNPNSGKTTIFNAITGSNQHVGNYPGVTVEKKVGYAEYDNVRFEIVDLQGTYSLTAYSAEELIARKYVIEQQPDAVINIVDASNLERNLYLTVQFLEMGIPLILALNMYDVADSRGMNIDTHKMSSLMGIPVVPVIGSYGRGIRQLLDEALSIKEKANQPTPQAISHCSQVISYSHEVDLEIEKIEKIFIDNPSIYQDTFNNAKPHWIALKLLEGDQDITNALLKKEIGPGIVKSIKSIDNHIQETLNDSAENIIIDYRYGYVSSLLKKCLTLPKIDRKTITDQIDTALTHKFIGPVFLFSIIWLLYQFVFIASEKPVEWLGYLFDWAHNWTTFNMSEGLLRSLLVSGIIDGVGGVMGFVPLIMFMFLFIAILEDTGYMARIAFLLDRVLRAFGLHGNSILSLIISGGIAGGCAVPGVMATRTLRDPNERLATILVSPFMNCGAKLPVFALFIAAFFDSHQGSMMYLITILAWLFSLFAAKALRSTILKGQKAPFVMELPPYRMPTIRGLLTHMWERSWHYIKKAGTIIMAISIILWALMTFPSLPETTKNSFHDQKDQLTQTFLKQIEVRFVLESENKLAQFETLIELMRTGKDFDINDLGLEEPERHLYYANAIINGSGTGPANLFTRSYQKYHLKLLKLDNELAQSKLANSVAGRLGKLFEHISKPLMGVDWRTNIALIGGFAAKEAIISTLGTAYSLGSIDPGESSTLANKLRKDPNWNPLIAFVLIVFIMLYSPCFATIAVIKRETHSWKWPLFAMGYSTVLAILMATIIYQTGTLIVNMG